MSQAPYGYCPICRCEGASRERSPNGNDRCQAGHVYPSASALQRNAPASPAPAAMPAESQPFTSTPVASQIPPDVRDNTASPAAQPVAQEPAPYGWVVWWLGGDGKRRPVFHAGAERPSYGTQLDAMVPVLPVYTTAPAVAQPLTPLTDEQVFKAAGKWSGRHDDLMGLIRAIEKACAAAWGVTLTTDSGADKGGAA